MKSEAGTAHRALNAVFARLYGLVEGARFERRGDLILALDPRLPIPQCNGPWVIEDRDEAAEGLADAIAQVDAAGVQPWVQTRSGHERTQHAATELGLTHRERLPGMAIRPGELAKPDTDRLEIDAIADEEIPAAIDVLAVSFGAPRELFDLFCAVLPRIEEASWYVGRVDGEIVATALGIDGDGTTGVFNVATAPDHRGRGYGAALTAHVVRDGFAEGAELAYLQSSEMGHGVYRQLGFRDVEEYVLLTRPA